MRVRAADNSGMNSGLVDWQTIAKDGRLDLLTNSIQGKQYIQYEATLISGAVLNNVTVNYNQYPATGSLTSSVYDTQDSTNVPSSVAWATSGTGSDETIKLQVRTSADGNTWTSWCGASACNDTDTFTSSPGTISSSHPLITDSIADRYIQYKALFTSSGDATLTLTSVSLSYVINVAPDVTNVTAVQGSTSLVTVGYNVADTDTSTGVVDVTLQYCPTGLTCTQNSDTNWVNATAVTGHVGTGVALGTSKTITWTPATDYSNQYNSGEKIRVKASDRELANAYGYGISSSFTLDTAVPVITVATLDSSATPDRVNITATDNSTITYSLCNASNFTGCDTWLTIDSGVATSSAWSATGSPNAETVYIKVRDAYGNVSTNITSVTAPATPASFLNADISNPAAQSYGEALSWLVVTNAASYKVYYATTTAASTVPSASAYTLLASPTSNIYSHNITTATSSAYWYKVAAINTNGDISNFTTMATGDVPDSYGTQLPDSAAPVITASSVAISSNTLKSTSATITFTTDEIASSTIRYSSAIEHSPTPDDTCAYDHFAYSGSTYVTSHSVSLTSLTPNTDYYFCISAADAVGNTTSPTQNASYGTFTFHTTSGPIVSGVTDQNTAGNSTTIFWNTSVAADSHAYYSMSNTLANPTVKGTADLVTTAASPGVYQHQVGLSGLTSGVKYYYYVTSTDTDGNTTTDNNNGAYYNFTTTTDTTAPAISNITTPVLSATAAVITWQTDEPATSQITWGTASGALTRTTVLDSTASIYHIVTLSSATNDTTSAMQVLTASTPYYYKVFSADTTGNQASSTEKTLTTPSSGDVTIVAGGGGSGGAGSGSTSDANAAKIISATVDNITAFGADVKVTTDKDTVTTISYGPTAVYGSSVGTTLFSASKTISLSNLTEGTTYHYQVIVFDKAGHTTSSGDQTFDTTFASEALDNLMTLSNAAAIQNKLQDLIQSALPSLAPPFITSPVVSSTTESSATITWNTNVKTMGTLRYATAADYAANKDYTTEVSADPVDSMAVAHAVGLAALTPNTLYHFQARSYVFPQVVGSSPDITFSTRAAAISPNIVAVKNNGFTVVWQSADPTSSIVNYKNVTTGQSAVLTDETKTSYHSVEIKDLPSGATYTVFVSGKNANGNTAGSDQPISVTTSVDLTPPVISNFKVDNALIPGRADLIQTVVGWQTDKLANSTVYYEEGAGSQNATSTELKNKTESLDVYSTSHVMILASLKPGTVYRIKIVSTDQSGNTKTFGPTSIITPQQTQSVLDIIVKNFADTFSFLGAGQ